MDKLLMSRVRQLQGIADRLDRLTSGLKRPMTLEGIAEHVEGLRQLKLDVEDMVRAAEAEYEAF